MKPDFRKIIYFLYGPLIIVLGFFMRSYKANRERLDNFLTKEKVSSFLKVVAVIVLLAWIVIFSFAPEEKRKELTLEIKQAFDNINSSAEK